MSRNSVLSQRRRAAQNRKAYFAALPLRAFARNGPLLSLLVLTLCSCSSQPASDVSRTAVAPVEIDAALAHAVTDALGEREGTIVVMDPQTGRIRAIVNPRLAFEQAFPPGSTIKPFTALAAMRQGLIDTESRRACRGRYTRGRFEFVCSHPRTAGSLSLTQALGYSCNYYFATVAERLSESAFTSTLGPFGFGARTGVNGAGESTGRFISGDIGERGDYGIGDALGEGEHLLVTPIQLLTAYVALINGGRVFRPQIAAPDRFVREVTRTIQIADGYVETLIEGMRRAVRYGTAHSARLDSLGVPVFGKTGTSTASNGFRSQGWFVGFAADESSSPDPDDVKLAVLVFLRRGHGSDAAEVARPVFEEFAGTVEAGPVTTERVAEMLPQDSALPVRVHLVRQNETRTLALEDYVAGVLAGEASVESESEALKAQAIASRTFALKNLGRHKADGYDFCSTTHCQRYIEVETANKRDLITASIASTEGEVLKDDRGSLLDAYFSAACGGRTANIESLWGVPAPSYLQGVEDEFCASMPHRNWVEVIPTLRLNTALRSDPRTDIGGRLDNVVVMKRDATGRAQSVALEGDRRRLIGGWEFKLIVGRSLGWNVLKSSRFDVRRSGSSLVFRGSGFGHGLGLCQEGAHVMATRGNGYRRILQHYFSGSRIEKHDSRLEGSGEDRSDGRLGYKQRVAAVGDLIQPLALQPFDSRSSLAPIDVRQAASLSPRFVLEPIRMAVGLTSAQAQSPTGVPSGRRSLSSEHFRISYPVYLNHQDVELMLRLLEAARNDVERRLASASLHPIERGLVEVTLHRTTQEFMAATGQPWWTAAATRGSRIDLQPVAVLKRRRILETTLRHEYTHVAIESLTTQAPRWLVEGLAIHVAGEGPILARVRVAKRLSTDEIDQRLSQRLSAEEMRIVYAEAYRHVLSFLKSLGEAGLWRRLA